MLGVPELGRLDGIEAFLTNPTTVKEEMNVAGQAHAVTGRACHPAEIVVTRILVRHHVPLAFPLNIAARAPEGDGEVEKGVALRLWVPER